MAAEAEIITAAAPIPIAVAHPVADLLIGPLRAATILAAHSAAVVLCVEPPADPDLETGATARVITVLTRDASGVPNGARTTLTAADRPFASIRVGDAAFVGAGQLRIGAVVGNVVRTIRTSVPRISAGPAAVRTVATVAAEAPHGVDSEPVDALRAALDAGDPTRLRAAARALVGLGDGSTPGGDDVLAGTVAALLATRRDVLAQQIAAAVLPDLASRTPLLSADLLRLATLGHVCTEAGAVLRAAHSHRPLHHDDLPRALETLLAIGHTSGADLATGLAIGMAVAPQPLPRRPRQSRRSSTSARTA